MDNDGSAARGNSEEGFHGIGIAQISDHHFHFLRDELDGPVIGKHQGPDLFTLLQQLGADVGAQEACGTGQQIIAFVVHSHALLKLFWIMAQL